MLGLLDFDPGEKFLEAFKNVDCSPIEMKRFEKQLNTTDQYTDYDEIYMLDPLTGVDDGDEGFKTIKLSDANRRLSELQRMTDEFPPTPEYVSKSERPG
jgi:hypothetical protein